MVGMATRETCVYRAATRWSVKARNGMSVVSLKSDLCSAAAIGYKLDRVIATFNRIW